MLDKKDIIIGLAVGLLICFAIIGTAVGVHNGSF